MTMLMLAPLRVANGTTIRLDALEINVWPAEAETRVCSILLAWLPPSCGNLIYVMLNFLNPHTNL